MSKRILYIGNALSKSGNTITSIETLGNFLKAEGYEVVTASSKKNQGLRLLHMMWNTYKHRNKVSSVLIDTYSTRNFWYAVLVSWICRKFNLKYYPILRGGDLPSRLAKDKKRCDKLFGKAAANIAPSGYLEKAFTEAGFKNVIYIPNTIEIDQYDYKSRPKVAPKLLWVRSFANLYNPKMALEVLDQLQKIYPETLLCMVGPEKDGSLEECTALAKAKQLPVKFTGRLAKKEWIDLSADYDIFINTTNFDNTPVSVIEAMALGLPIVSTDVGGMPFLVTHNKDGLLSPQEDVKQMVAHIERLLKDSSFGLELASTARAKVETFDWNVVKSQWKQLLS